MWPSGLRPTSPAVPMPPSQEGSPLALGASRPHAPKNMAPKMFSLGFGENLWTLFQNKSFCSTAWIQTCLMISGSAVRIHCISNQIILAKDSTPLSTIRVRDSMPKLECVLQPNRRKSNWHEFGAADCSLFLVACFFDQFFGYCQSKLMLKIPSYKMREQAAELFSKSCEDSNQPCRNG